MLFIVAYMLRRVITSIGGLCVVIGGLLIGRWGFSILWAVVGFVLLCEWQKGEKMPLPIFLGVIPVVSLIWISGVIPSLWRFTLSIFMIEMMLFIIFMEPKRDFLWTYRAVWGLVFLGVGWGSLLWIFFPDYVWWKVLAFLSLVWVADTAAYFGGKMLGKHPILPRVSPNKTWEGFIGGALATSAWSMWAVEWAGGPTGVFAAVVGLAVAVIGFFGDAWQSAWKRQLGLKDSGALLPGHGGVWDRIDALL
ncbi:MAG: phosphatidate cytidylyltransferase, partial [Bacteroidia bacterium]|nr:phosphatidate cytidylyltransferase [Bacteroidia bacterium]MDW8134818.1 phosphatidate cytidylyltransferase [Bacteroidia bacterium]